MLNDIIPAAWRKPIYAVFAVVGVALGAVASAYGPEHVPTWHAVTMNVYLYIGGALGFTAAANTIVGGKFTGNEPVEREEDELVGPEGEGQDVELTEDELEHVADDDALADAVDEEAGFDEAQAQLDAALAADVDDTPVADDYEPRH